MKTIEKSIISIIFKSAEAVGTLVEEEWSQWLWSYLYDIKKDGIDSPIEQMFLVGFKTIERLGLAEGIGELRCQEKIGPYRVDFLLVCENPGVQQVVVECDGHEFHEKTKEQVMRDKKRDRFLIIRGYKVVHFSGSEIYKNPFLSAIEAVHAALGVTPLIEKEGYSWLEEYLPGFGWDEIDFSSKDKP
ncbi:MAG: hypothetical protein DRP65_07975 [Planctomycetota bacterium]|nr:MAG: hypothetical protein DRP65_07975 [Planctomycetota bacterium]